MSEDLKLGEMVNGKVKLKINGKDRIFSMTHYETTKIEYAFRIKEDAEDAYEYKLKIVLKED